jgi:hypothetical protein
MVTNLDIHIRRQNSDHDLTAMVRCWDGVFDLQRLDGIWHCSCGEPQMCSHVPRVLEALADRVVA